MNSGLSGALVASLLIATAVAALPVTAIARLARARRPGLGWCAGAVAIGLFCGALVAQLPGGALGGPLAAAAGGIAAMRWMLGTSLFVALGLTLVALVIALVLLFALTYFGVVGSGPVVTASL